MGRAILLTLSSLPDDRAVRGAGVLEANSLLRAGRAGLTWRVRRKRSRLSGGKERLKEPIRFGGESTRRTAGREDAQPSKSERRTPMPLRLV